MTTRLRPILLGTALATSLVLTACGDGAGAGSGSAEDTESAATSGAAEGGSLSVVAAFYPLEFLTSQVGGDRVDLTGLTPPGAEAHDLELSPQALAGLTESDLIVALDGFQPAVDEAVSGIDVPVVDLIVIADRPYEADAEHAGEEDEHSEDEDASEGEHEEDEDEHAGEDEDAHGDTDPHFWTDPTHMSGAAGMIAEALTEADPDGADTYSANLDEFTARMTELDAEAEEALGSCEIDTLVTAHDAFGYFADRHGFELRSINGLNPDEEPDAGALAEISDFVADSNITTVYTETLVPSDFADTVAAEAGVGTAVLDPIEGITEESAGEDYFEVMRANIDAVRAGQECS